MSDIVAENARVRDAFERPTLRLLDSTWAPIAISIFRSAFSRERRTIPAERLHAQVDAHLAELAANGIDTPTADGRTLCLSWMRSQWLTRTGSADGDQYTLTSHAHEALEVVASLARDRALISESRLATIIAAVRRTAVEAAPDPSARITMLDAQIAELAAERDRLASGGDPGTLDEDRMMDAVANLQDLIGALPSDFKRVEESMATMHRTIMERFRSDDRPVGAVISDYLARSDQLIRDTPEGRAFDGAFELLRDDALLAELRANLATIVNHPSASVLTPAEAREFLSTVAVIRTGTDDVLTQRHQLSATLREHIVAHDVATDRELDQTLRALARELGTWMRTARPRSYIHVPLLPDTLDIEHLTERMHDPASTAAPPPLDDVSDTAGAPPDIDTLRTLGGPTMSELRRRLATTSAPSAAAAFNELPASLRRPVEILGLLHAIDDTDQLNLGTGTETYAAMRPDGTPVQFTATTITLGQEEPA